MEHRSRCKCFAWLFRRQVLWAVVLLACAGLAPGEPIPLWNDQILQATVISSGRDRLVVRTDGSGKEVILRWDQVKREFRLHPLHGKSLDGPLDATMPAAGAAPQGQDGEAAEAPGAMGSSARFVLFLGFVFAWFWINLWSVRVASLWGPQDDKGPLRRLLALFLGPPVALYCWIYRHRAGAYLPSTGPTPRSAEATACQFYTWENEPLKAGRKSSSGLNVAQQIFSRAIGAKASDVHFNTTSEGVKVSFRVDGVLLPPELLSADSGRKAMAALKMAAGMDMAKRHETQDGACRLQAGDNWFDLRIARAWAVEGETLVVRILRAGGESTDLTDFGMSTAMASLAADLTSETSGIIVLAGPTGSGKTTTIYALLKLIEGTGRNILTIEDPVEHRLQNATQISLNTKIGATFANALRASMRHDPDVILVGEIRDAETMDVAFQAALTGHLVFTTLHATGLLAVIGRLQELGLSSYMIKTGLQAIVCQRLVRKLCPSCRQAYLADEEELKFWGLDPNEHQGTLFYKPQGCHLCDDSGYHGRIGVFRMVAMDSSLRAKIQNEIDVETLQPAIESAALGTVAEYAKRFLGAGVTSPDELRRTLGMFDFNRRGVEG